MAVSILDKIDFRVKKITKNREMLYQGLIHQKKKKVILNVFVLKNRVANYVEQKLTELKEETDKSTIIAGDCNTLCSTIDRATRPENKQDYRKMTQF